MISIYKKTKLTIMQSMSRFSCFLLLVINIL